MPDQTIYHDTESGVYKSDAFQSDEGKSRHYEAIIEDSPDGGYHLRVELYEEGASAPIQSWETDEVQSVDEAERGLGEFAKNWKIHKAYVEENIFEPDEPVAKSPTQRSTLTSSDKQNPPGTENSDKKPSTPPPTPENRLQTQPKDTQPIPDAAPDHRTTTTKPSENHRTQHSSSASDIADAFDRQRDEAKRGIAIWRGQLDEMVQDSGSIWSVLGATAAATALSVTELAMDQASGLLGVTRLGQGVAQGTFSGVMEDVDRLASVLPQGRLVKALGMSADVYAVGKAAATGGDPLSIAANVAGAVIGAKSKKRGRQAGGQDGNLRVQSARTLSQATRAKYLKRVQELHKALDLRGRAGKTTAILIARDPKTGALKTLVSSSMERVPKKVRDKMKGNEYEVRGTKKSKNSSPNDHAHHAEVNGLSAIMSMGWEVVEVFPSRNACSLCSQMRKTLGVKITDPK